MNNSISGSLGLIATLSSIIAVTAQPQAGLAQSKTASLSTPEAAVSVLSPAITEATPDAVKLGEQQPVQRIAPAKDITVAKVQTHEIAGKQTATLYVRNIPVLTFTMPQVSSIDETKVGTVNPEVGVSQKLKAVSSDAQDIATPSSKSSLGQDPTARASAIAARINQLYREGVDAKQIAVSWKEAKNAAGQIQGQYVISANKSELVTINPFTLSAGGNQNLEQDALQVTNRLRRLLGDAAPINQIEGKPDVVASVSTFDAGTIGSVISTTKGWASWYGPGFHGNLTANGERFNQEAMTAAHPSLPMGTQVRVTSLDTGRTVIVRINDRGPYAGDRILDLSAGAARVIGLMDSGVGLIRLDVLGR